MGASPSAMEKTAPTPAPTSTMGTRTVRSANHATGIVPSNAAAPARAAINRISASER